MALVQRPAFKRDLLSDYETIPIARGGQATVYFYSCPRSDQTFAVKVSRKATPDRLENRIGSKRKPEWQLREVNVIQDTDHVRLLLRQIRWSETDVLCDRFV